MVYFVQDTVSGHIKIGYTSKPATWRLSLLQTGNPNPLRLLITLPGGEQEEARLHRKFAVARHRGEWFHPWRMLLGYIIDHAEESQTEPNPPEDPLGVGVGLVSRR